MRAAVLGSSGFIGSHVLDVFASAEIETAGIDVVAPRWSQPTESYLIDIADDRRLRSALRAWQPDVIVNAAGVLGTAETFGNPNSAIASNVTGSMNALTEAMALSAHYILLDTGTRWPNPYSITKHAAADLAIAYARQMFARVTVLRLFNLYGPRQSGVERVRKLVPTFIDRALKGEALPIFGSGSQTVDLVHVEDCAAAVYRSVLRAQGEGEVIDVGTGHPRTVLEVAQRVIDEFGGRGEIEFVGNRLGEGDGHPIADLRACRDVLAFTPEPGLDRLASTVGWFRVHGVSWEGPESRAAQPGLDTWTRTVDAVDARGAGRGEPT